MNKCDVCGTTENLMLGEHISPECKGINFCNPCLQKKLKEVYNDDLMREVLSKPNPIIKAMKGKW